MRPLLSGQSLNQLRLALSLTIEQAQWAALNGQAKVYTQALDDARSVLLANFNADNPQSKAMLASLNELAEQPVSVVTPDLSEPGRGAGVHPASPPASGSRRGKP